MIRDNPECRVRSCYVRTHPDPELGVLVITLELTDPDMFLVIRDEITMGKEEAENLVLKLAPQEY